jgi:GcrA cell cycle regulator
VKAGDTPAATVDEKVVESLSPPAEIPAAPAAAPAAKKPAPVPTVAAPLAAPAPRPISPAPSKSGGKTTLLELSDKICKWPIGHPGEPDFHFCGRPVQAGFPYCGEHCAIAYQAQLPRRDRTPRPLPPVVSNIRR